MATGEIWRVHRQRPIRRTPQRITGHCVVVKFELDIRLAVILRGRNIALSKSKGVSTNAKRTLAKHAVAYHLDSDRTVLQLYCAISYQTARKRI